LKIWRRGCRKGREKTDGKEQGKGESHTFTAAHALEGTLVAEEVLATLDGEGETGVNVLCGLLDLLGGSHCSTKEPDRRIYLLLERFAGVGVAAGRGTPDPSHRTAGETSPET
jgi:hypothetical protein